MMGIILMSLQTNKHLIIWWEKSVKMNDFYICQL